MVPNASEITRRRITAATVIRLGAAAFAHGAFVPTMIFVIELIEGRNMNRFGSWGPFLIPALMILAVAVIVWSLAPWVARLMIRVPRVPVCPNCRFKLEGLMAPTCLECGYTLTPEFLTTKKERAQNAREPDTIWLRQIATLIIRLVYGSLAPASAVAAFILASEAIRSPRYNTWTPVIVWVFTGLFAVGSFLFASNLSILMVPRRKRFAGRGKAQTEPSVEREDAG